MECSLLPCVHLLVLGVGALVIMPECRISQHFVSVPNVLVDLLI
jgi:hypothetical protein